MSRHVPRADILDALDWLEYSATIKNNVLMAPEINQHNEMVKSRAELVRIALFSCCETKT